MKHYEVSVVTPFHNVDTDVFIAGIESMKAQTYGFEDIEWIVVAHNCTPEHKKEVHRLLDGYPNVILKELDNERRTPSSPRNYGLSFATVDYVGFLDADDSYTPETLISYAKGYAKIFDAGLGNTMTRFTPILRREP